MPYKPDPEERAEERPRVVQHEEIHKGKKDYEVTEIERRDKSRFMLAKRSDSKKPFGNIFGSVKDVQVHYPSIADELDKLFHRRK